VAERQPEQLAGRPEQLETRQPEQLAEARQPEERQTEQRIGRQAGEFVEQQTKGKPEQLLEKLVQEPPEQVLNERHLKKLLVSRSRPAGTREQLMALERSKAPEEIEKWQPKQQIQHKRLDGRLTKGNWSEAKLSGDIKAMKEGTELLELEHKALEGIWVPMLELFLPAERNLNYRQLCPWKSEK
jgi:hypothetical protein